MKEQASNKLSGLRRHFQGWQIGLVLVLAAGITASVAVPRPVVPSQIPLPAIKRAQALEELAEERARAARAKEQPLPFEVRAIGEGVRRVGVAEFAQLSRRGIGASERLQELQGAAHRLLAASDKNISERLLELRAVQTEFFVSALMNQDLTEALSLLKRAEPARQAEGQLSPSLRDLEELGGGFILNPQYRSWFSGGKFVGGEIEASVLFRMRWNQLCGVASRAPFQISSSDWLVYLRFVLRYPEGADLRAQAAKRMSYLQRLEGRQAEYPLALARGTVLYQMGQYQLAGMAFEEQLAQSPSGPWSLRARNHLLAASRATAASLGDEAF